MQNSLLESKHCNIFHTLRRRDVSAKTAPLGVARHDDLVVATTRSRTRITAKGLAVCRARIHRALERAMNPGAKVLAPGDEFKHSGH